MLRVTKTENGAVRGIVGTDARITAFKGIPFAAPPVGDLRWKAPQPAADWEGVRDCYEFGPITMQKVPGINPDAFYSKEWHVEPEIAMSEDGLYLNIWTPAKSADEKLPVMVWFFGGGLQEGYAYEMEFDGERIASRGVILVSVAYRLNVFGFLAHPDLTAEDPDAPTNFGYLDQLAGMKWVERNIANFGGDPGNITIFGQSAGGGSVLSHLESPMSRGHFQKAIPESAGGVNFLYPACMFRTRENLASAEAKGVEFLEKHLGVKTIAEARKLDAKFIEDKMHEAGLRIGCCVDGKFTLEDPSDALRCNRFANVPIMIGNTVDEFPTGAARVTAADIDKWIDDNFGKHADEFRTIAKEAVGDDPESIRKFAAYSTFQQGAQLAVDYLGEQGRDVYYYQFGPTIPGDNAGVYHSSDLWFEFETLMKCWRPFDGHHYDISRKMCNYWTNFAKTGNPNGNDADGTPMPEWKKVTADAKPEMDFYDKVDGADGEYSKLRRFLIDINRAEIDK